MALSQSGIGAQCHTVPISFWASRTALCWSHMVVVSGLPGAHNVYSAPLYVEDHPNSLRRRCDGLNLKHQLPRSGRT